VWRPRSGASKSIPGGCQIPEGGAFGTGTFVWPAANRSLSGNDYWDGHLAIDIAAATGAPVYATDSGVVVYAASIGGGYGNMVMIDHGNGYHSVYAHLSQIVARCGQSTYQGNIVGYAGSTGNSTGPHLHFEVRYMGGFINPWHVLP
jgi:murein DD-endopeptidase MepM/ murein hydrolase activator NlpD